MSVSKSICSIITAFTLLMMSTTVDATSPDKSIRGPQYSLKIENNTDGFEIRVVDVEFECEDCGNNLLAKLKSPKSPPDKFKELFPQTTETETWMHFKPKTLLFEVYKENSMLAISPKVRDRVVVDLTRDGKMSGPKYDGYYNKSGKYMDFKGKTWVDVEVKWEGNDCTVLVTSQIM